MADGIVRKGRGFAAQSSHPEHNRLDRPIFIDEELDREDIVPRPRRAPQGTNHRARNTSPPAGTNGGVKVGMHPPIPTQDQEPQERRPKNVKPEWKVFTPRFRREPVCPEQEQTVDKPARRKSDNSGMDFSRVTRPSFRMQTFRQALTPQPMDVSKPLEQASPVGGLRLEGTSRPPTGAKAPRATPVQKKVLTEALKSLPPRVLPNSRFRNPAAPKGPAAPPPVAEVAMEEIPVKHVPTGDHSSETSAVVAEETPQHHEPAMSHHSAGGPVVVTEEVSQHHEPAMDNHSGTLIVTTEVTTDIQLEESLANTGIIISATEQFESYQLGADEKFASESSDESESVTSTIHEYDEVSESEAASGDEIVRKKVRKPKPVETSDGLVYYKVAVGEEPYVPLTYEIPFEELTRLLGLKVDSKLRYWTYDLYRHEEKKITVECCTTLEEFETAAQKFRKEKALGFDMEWLPRPSKRVWDNVSLIQLAKEDHIALFHLGRVKKENVDELIPLTLKEILESKDILKVGVSIAGDGSRIKKWLGIEPQGLMELSAIHHMIEYARERRRGQVPKVLVSLAKLAEKYLHLPIDKGSVRTSDWTRPLTPIQISYAATDAYAGLRIFDALQKARMLVDPIPTLPLCVKCGGDKKKRGVVTPKLYIDGVEAGSNSVSTWDTNFQATAQSTGNAIVMDWAQEVEESRMGSGAAKVRGPGKKNKNPGTSNIHGETSSNGRSNTKRSTKTTSPLSPEVEFATDWAKKHQARRTVGDTTVAPLKAYALWHWKEYTLEETARHLEITVKTAAQYILTATRADQLEYDRERMKYVWSMGPWQSSRIARKL